MATRSPSFGPSSVATIGAVGNEGSQSPATSQSLRLIQYVLARLWEVCMFKKTLLQTAYPPGFSLKASSQVDSELKAVEDGDLEKTSLTSSHSAVKDSWTFGSEGEANYTCPTPTTD